MPTNPLLPITELDFFRVKSQLKDFLKNDTNGKFKDIDFEGSNISVLLDVLSYNTYQNNFYTNMAISEMFLDSAQLENSVVSHAKELNYLPRSVKSAKAVVSVSISDEMNNTSTMVIPKGTRFTTIHEGERYNFFTDVSYTARKENDQFVARNVEIFEGELIEEAFFVSGDRKSIRLINSNIDISSITVFENFDEPIDRIEYIYRNDVFGVDSLDPVFYVEPSFDGTYEVLFGNNRFGKTPEQNKQIRVFYRVSSGSDANGACKFSASIPGDNSSALENSVTVLTPAVGGAEKESLEDIKFFAPRSIQVQERAVTERDYEILLKQRFNEIRDVSVFGGDELDPPRFGKVAIAVNLEGGLSDSAASRYESFLRDKTPVAIQPIFLPPEYLYTELFINVSYDPKQTSQSKDSIESEIRELLKKYSKENLNKFGSVFEISRVSTLIDSVNSAIVNNTISALPYILYAPDFNKVENPSFTFGQNLESPCRFARANRTESYNSFIKSNTFTFNGSNALFEDNGLGVINILKARNRSLGQIEIIRRNAGTVDYEKGIVKLSDFVADSYESPGIRIIANTQEKNITSPKRRVLKLNDKDVTIEFKEVERR